MPPKSATKREPVLWYLCEKCNANVTTKAKEQHEEICPLDTEESRSKCCFVRDEKFHSNQLGIKGITDDVRELNARQLKSLVFVSESVIGLCGFILGEPVVLRIQTDASATSVVRFIWPLPNSMLTNVQVAEEGIL